MTHMSIAMMKWCYGSDITEALLFPSSSEDPPNLVHTLHNSLHSVRFLITPHSRELATCVAVSHCQLIVHVVHLIVSFNWKTPKIVN